MTARNQALRLLRAAQWQRVAEERATAVIQRLVRGFFGRLAAQRLRAAHGHRSDACVVLQRNYRASRILHWRHLRMNKVAAFVFERRRRETRASSATARRRRADFAEAQAAKDSCSEDDDDQDADAWVERIDAKGNVSFANVRSGRVVQEDPRMSLVDAELLGWRLRVYWIMMDRWYDGVISKFHQKKRRYRIDYDDGDYEWLDFEQARSRVQLFDASGHWALFDQAHRPALEARRRVDVDAKNLARKARKLEEESKCWQYLDGGEEEKAADADIKNSKPENEDNKPVFFSGGPSSLERWLNTSTGEIRIRDDDDRGYWLESRDDQGNFCFLHAESGERLYRDPRFRPISDFSPEVALAKAQCLDDARYGAYLANALVEDWEQQNPEDNKAQRAFLKKVAKAKVAIRSFSAALARARDLWPQDAFTTHDELPYFSHVLKQVLDLLNRADAQAEEDQLYKRALIANAKRTKATLCTTCGHEVPQSKTHCLFCGNRS